MASPAGFVPRAPPPPPHTLPPLPPPPPHPPLPPMDPAPDPLAASAPFPTIPAAAPSPRPRVTKPRRQAAAFRSDHPVAFSTGQRPGGEFPIFALAGVAGSGSRPSTAGVRSAGSTPTAFVFVGDAVSSHGVEEDSSSVSSWSSSSDAKIVFGSGVSGTSEAKRSFSFGSGGSDDASLSSISATIEELILNDSSGKQSNANGGNSSVGDSGDEGDFTKDGSKVSANGANGGDVEQKLFVFGECASSGHRRFAANIARSDIKRVDSAHKEHVTYSSEQLDPSASEDSACTKLQPAHGSSNRDPPHLGPLDIPDTEKENAAHFNFGSQYDGVKVSFAKLPDGIETQRTLAAASVLGEYGFFDEKSFTVHDHNATCRDKGGVKGMNMNRRAVKPKKFTSARQVSSLETVFISDRFSGKVAPEINLHLKEVVSFGLEESGICIGNCCPEEVDATRTTESSHDGTGFTFAANLENSGQSDFTFASSSFDHSKLHSQRRHNKRNCGGMGNNANSVQSLPTSAIGLAHPEVSASQLSTTLGAQWTEYSKAEPKLVTVSRGQICTKTENFGYQEDCETWRIRGNQAYSEGQLAKAEECYTHGINSVSPNETSWKALMLCYSNRAATRMSLGRMREALSDCQKATDIDSSFLKAQVRAANCLLALGDVEEAQKGFEVCLKSNHAASMDHKIVEEASDGLQKAQRIG